MKSSKAQGANKQEYRQIPLMCKISRHLSHNIVSFQSCVVLSNNTNFPITFVTSNDSARLDNEHDKITILPNTADVMPLSWIVENKVFGYLDSNKSFKKIAQKFSGIFPAYIPEEFGFQPGLINFADESAGTEKVMATFDLAAFSCHSIGNICPCQYLVSINPPLIIHNLLMKPLEVKYKGKLIAALNPGEQTKVYACAGEQFAPDKQLELKILLGEEENNDYFYSNSFKKSIKPGEVVDEPIRFERYSSIKKERVVPNKANKNLLKYFNAQITIAPMSNFETSLENFELRDKIFEKCWARKMTIFAKQLVVNQTNMEIKIGEKGKAVRIKSGECSIVNVSQGTKTGFSVKGYCNYFFY